MAADYPILEYDDAREAIINPHPPKGAPPMPERCVLCFFYEVLADLRDRGTLVEALALRTEMGFHPVYRLEHEGLTYTVMHPGIGAPLAAGLLEEALALGCRKVIVCGGAGVLNREIVVGHLIVPHAAVRDEGTSYHYLPPAREVAADPAAVAAIERVLVRRDTAYLLGKTWTTDAFYRETPARIARRREEGCLTVEMEAAALFAVARFRGVTLGQILYGGDDVSGSVWDHRDWYSRRPVRERLFWLAVEACAEL